MKILDIRVTEISPHNYEVEVSDPYIATTDVYATTHPQKTVLSVLKSHNIKGKRGRKAEPKKIPSDFEQVTIDDLGFVDAGDLG